jgi:MinD superfamily P-loop ATPase
MIREYKKCGRCKSAGTVRETLATATGVPLEYLSRCPECDGCGYVVPVDEMKRRETSTALAMFFVGVFVGGVIASSLMYLSIH